MTRRADWRARLAAFIRARRDRALVWGDSDCCLTAAAAIEAMCGAHPAPELVGAYASPAGAVRALAHLRVRRVRDLVAARFARTPRARCGDLILVANAPLDVLMIADGRGAGWGQEQSGLIRAALPARFEAWSV
ncbi:MAG: hypothetical protein GC206_13510 [Alphaproteobacteria bacterium]|nr:hypothetical protein [Alphaproteobacteria bacterium]